MECFIAKPQDIDARSGELLIRGDEAKHLVRSLRMREGEPCMVSDLNGVCYRCTIKDTVQSKSDFTVKCRIDAVLVEHNESEQKVGLAFGLLHKQSDIELILEKCTEIGICEFYPFISSRTQRSSLNIDRCLRIIESAVKQVSRARMPVLHQVLLYEEVLEKLMQDDQHIFLFHEGVDSIERYNKNISRSSSVIVIGAEGGFTDDEVTLAISKYNAKPLSLGPRRLRAETAAIAAASLLLC